MRALQRALAGHLSLLFIRLTGLRPFCLFTCRLFATVKWYGPGEGLVSADWWSSLCVLIAVAFDRSRSSIGSGAAQSWGVATELYSPEKQAFDCSWGSVDQLSSDGDLGGGQARTV